MRPTPLCRAAARAGDFQPLIEADDRVTDTFLDALARASGPIGVQVGGGTVASVPGDPAIAKVLRDCRGAGS